MHAPAGSSMMLDAAPCPPYVSCNQRRYGQLKVAGSSAPCLLIDSFCVLPSRTRGAVLARARQPDVAISFEPAQRLRTYLQAFPIRVPLSTFYHHPPAPAPPPRDIVATPPPHLRRRYRCLATIICTLTTHSDTRRTPQDTARPARGNYTPLSALGQLRPRISTHPHTHTHTHLPQTS
jgi:hypothetical protein